MKTLNALILTIFFSVLNLLANNVATITAMRGDADIKRDGELIIASLGAKLEQKDNILTKDNTKLQVIFKDETVISIGKNSEFSIQEYLFEDNQAPVAKFGMLRGAMRTITGQIGNIAPQRFSVATKTATIGIRGTNFSVFVEEDGSSSAFCTFGAISVAIAGTTHVVQQGFYISLSPKGEVTIKEFTPEVLKEKKEKHFDPDEKKKDVLADGGDAGKQGEEDTDSSNTVQLDVTTDDNSGMIITDVSETVAETTQQTETSTSTLTPLSDIQALASQQSTIYYEGTFSGTSSGSFDTSGSANFTANFGQDTSSLTLNGNNEVSATYNTFGDLLTNSISSVQNGSSEGSANLEFHGANAATAQGTYRYGEYVSPGDATTASGTFTLPNQINEGTFTLPNQINEG